MKTSALRVAAYLLIAHLAIVTALSFMAKGTPDYVRILISAALLAGVVSSLFKPKKRGWIIVAAYIAYVLIYQLVGAWTLWLSPAMTSGAKIVASIVFAVIHSPLIVAVVLIFKPGSFAAFTSPPPADTVKEAPAPNP